MTKIAKVETISGIAAQLLEPNVNTDVILPVRWMRAPTTAMGRGLFANLRYDEAGKKKSDFSLNQEPFREAQILLGGPNFGCGSSREAAVWALVEFGIRAVIAPSFGEIFEENSFQNRLLLVTLPFPEVSAIAAELAHADHPVLTVDLKTCVVNGPGGARQFAYSSDRREALLSGWDEIDTTLRFVTEIEAFKATQRHDQAWIYAHTSSEVKS